MAARSRVGLHDTRFLRLLVPIPVDIKVCLLRVLCVGWKSIRRLVNHCGVLPSAPCQRRRIHEATVHATGQRVKSPASEREASKLAMSIARGNEKAGRSACSALDHHSTSQR